MALGWFRKPDNISRPAPAAAGDAAPEAAEATPPAPPDGPRPATGAAGLLARLKRGLAKTHALLTTDIDDLLAGRNITEDLREGLEELLITADVGVETAMKLVDRINRRAARIATAEELKRLLREEILAVLQAVPTPAAAPPAARPEVMLVVGVNGVGKTTTIGKLAARYAADGKHVIIAAADTFRAAAGEQISIWAKRAGARLVRHQDGSDPAAVAFDAVETALARGADVVLIDTAGRLHTKVNLMEELKKIQRAIAKKLPGAPHRVLLVLDATTGQNALSQARLFHEALGVTGIALTKLDGTAKGGIVIAIGGGLKLPLEYIGVGEAIEDLQPFDPVRFTEALL
jgi:fused signal recognition particle receptor